MTEYDGKAILLLGYRTPAIRAARKLGLCPMVLETGERDGMAGVPRLEVAPRPETAAAGARHLCADVMPVTAVPVTEVGVTLAGPARRALGLPGAGPDECRRWTDKRAMKEAVELAGIPCARWLRVGSGTSASRVMRELGLPVVVKPPSMSGGRGVQVVRSHADLQEILEPGLLVEEYVDGVEMSVETFLKDGEVLFRNRTAYLAPRWANVLPADLSEEEEEAIDELVDRAHEALGVTDGMTHVELFLTEEGPVFGELAARPPGGGIMQLMDLAYGFDPWEAYLRLALGGEVEFPEQAWRHAGVWYLHPGAGVVGSVGGLEEARAIRGVHEVRCRLRPGDRVPPRLGCGEHKGRIVVTAAGFDDCTARLAAAHSRLSIVMRPEVESWKGVRRGTAPSAA